MSDVTASGSVCSARREGGDEEEDEEAEDAGEEGEGEGEAEERRGSGEESAESKPSTSMVLSERERVAEETDKKYKTQ